MDFLELFIDKIPDPFKERFLATKTTADVQSLLDDIPYRPEDENFCALSVFRDGRAHCFDGGLLAAAGLSFIGFSPKLIQMIPHNDDDHILAVYRQEGLWGAVAKSNFVGLRIRKPVYRTIRELIMSFFDVFYNVDGEFTLKAYSAPLDLTRIPSLDWLSSDNDVQILAKKLSNMRHYMVRTPDQLKQLGLVDSLTYKAGLMVANPAGLFNTKKK